MTLAEDFNGGATLMVAFNDEDEFRGLLADSGAGLFSRGAGHWITVSESNPVFGGSNIVNVDEDFLDFYDKLDQRGSEPTMKQVKTYIVAAEEPETEDAE